MDCDDVMNHEIETCDEEEQFCLRLKDGSELTLACAADPPREVTLDSSDSISKGSLKKHSYVTNVTKRGGGSGPGPCHKKNHSQKIIFNI